MQKLLASLLLSSVLLVNGCAHTGATRGTRRTLEVAESVLSTLEYYVNKYERDEITRAIIAGDSGWEKRANAYWEGINYALYNANAALSIAVDLENDAANANFIEAFRCYVFTVYDIIVSIEKRGFDLPKLLKSAVSKKLDADRPVCF